MSEGSRRALSLRDRKGFKLIGNWIRVMYSNIEESSLILKLQLECDLNTFLCYIYKKRKELLMSFRGS